ncbi:MAG: hypothetical protein IT232_11050 [Flavobacteriales bacterium]|nr:hypothetical protein [Flavobacteriales bacterium]
MVIKNLLLIFVIAHFISCELNHEKNNTINNIEFDSKYYYIEDISKRVDNFLLQNTEYSSISDFIIFSSNNYSSCAIENFSTLSKYFEKTNRKTLVLFSDSNLFNYKIANENVIFIQKPMQFFIKAKIVHSTPYLYVREKEKLISQEMNSYIIDSLIKHSDNQ